MTSETNEQSRNISPPPRSTGILSDIKYFLITKPGPLTLIKFKSEEEKAAFSQRILQRIGIEVSAYSVLNLHKIGINAPVQQVFEELLNWNGDSTCWPNHIAKVRRVNGQLETIEILLFGIKRFLFGFLSPLFCMKAISIHRTPVSSDSDNARYLLYKCEGGYPIGIFTMFLRSSISAENEVEPSQLFMGVGFDFYGRKNKSKFRPVNYIWEKIHDRVSVNILYRFKQFCEWRFEMIQKGDN